MNKTEKVMEELIEFIKEEGKKRTPKGKARLDGNNRVVLPKPIFERAGFDTQNVVSEVRNRPSIFDEGVIEKRNVFVFPNINFEE